MTPLLLATNNKHKVEEIRHFLSGLPYVVRSLADIPNGPVTVEDAPTLEGNALKKAREAFAESGMLSMADDTGLEVQALGMRPGVYSARYAGEGATYHDNCVKLLEELQGVPEEKRRAQFRTVIAIVGREFEGTVEGKVEGMILTALRGEQGFGYDPLFVPDGHSRSYAEMTIGEKNTLSHRARALEKAVTILSSL
ncbi:MAG: RdgB/HAM1 family non-canonical purine NTP pyrophosphatase [Bacteroidetes bacterium]|nr:RdgB/HAM1 family non-canonical purine NTP pyrophosphatase [Bacteroidota bacterium]